MADFIVNVRGNVQPLLDEVRRAVREIATATSSVVPRANFALPALPTAPRVNSNEGQGQASGLAAANFAQQALQAGGIAPGTVIPEALRQRLEAASLAATNAQFGVFEDNKKAFDNARITQQTRLGELASNQATTHATNLKADAAAKKAADNRLTNANADEAESKKATPKTPTTPAAVVPETAKTTTTKTTSAIDATALSNDTAASEIDGKVAAERLSQSLTADAELKAEAGAKTPASARIAGIKGIADKELANQGNEDKAANIGDGTARGRVAEAEKDRAEFDATKGKGKQRKSFNADDQAALIEGGGPLSASVAPPKIAQLQDDTQAVNLDTATTDNTTAKTNSKTSKKAADNARRRAEAGQDLPKEPTAAELRKIADDRLANNLAATADSITPEQIAASDAATAANRPSIFEDVATTETKKKAKGKKKQAADTELATGEKAVSAAELEAQQVAAQYQSLFTTQAITPLALDKAKRTSAQYVQEKQALVERLLSDTRLAAGRVKTTPGGEIIDPSLPSFEKLSGEAPPETLAEKRRRIAKENTAASIDLLTTPGATTDLATSKVATAEVNGAIDKIIAGSTGLVAGLAGAEVSSVKLKGALADAALGIDGGVGIRAASKVSADALRTSVASEAARLRAATPEGQAEQAQKEIDAAEARRAQIALEKEKIAKQSAQAFGTEEARVQKNAKARGDSAQAAAESEVAQHKRELDQQAVAESTRYPSQAQYQAGIASDTVRLVGVTARRADVATAFSEDPAGLAAKVELKRAADATTSYVKETLAAQKASTPEAQAAKLQAEIDSSYAERGKAEAEKGAISKQSAQAFGTEEARVLKNTKARNDRAELAADREVQSYKSALDAAPTDRQLYPSRAQNQQDLEAASKKVVAATSRQADIIETGNKDASAAQAGARLSTAKTIAKADVLTVQAATPDAAQELARLNQLKDDQKREAQRIQAEANNLTTYVSPKTGAQSTLTGLESAARVTRDIATGFPGPVGETVDDARLRTELAALTEDGRRALAKIRATEEEIANAAAKARRDIAAANIAAPGSTLQQLPLFLRGTGAAPILTTSGPQITRAPLVESVAAQEVAGQGSLFSFTPQQVQEQRSATTAAHQSRVLAAHQVVEEQKAFARSGGGAGGGGAGGGGTVPPGEAPPPGGFAGLYAKLTGKETNQSLGEFFGSGLATTARFAIPSALAYGSFNFLKQGLSDATELEKQFTLLHGVFETTFGSDADSKLKAFKQNIFDISTTTGVAATELAAIALQLQGALFSAKGITDSSSGTTRSIGGQELVDTQLKAAAKLIPVTGLSAAEIENQTTAVTLAFGKTANDLGDIAIRIQDKFGVPAKEIVTFLGDVAPVAAQAGASLDQMGAIGALALQRSGLSAAQLANNFNRLLPEITKNKAALIDLATTNSSLNNQKFLGAVASSDTVSVFLQIAHAYKDMSQSSQDIVDTLLGGRKDAQAIIPVFASGNLDQALGDVQNSAGALDKRFKELSGSLSQQFKVMKAEFQLLAVALANAGILDILKGFVNALSVFGTVLLTVSAVVGPFLRLFDGAPLRFIAMAASVLLLVKAIEALGVAQKGAALLGLISNVATGSYALGSDAAIAEGAAVGAAAQLPARARVLSKVSGIPLTAAPVAAEAEAALPEAASVSYAPLVAIAGALAFAVVGWVKDVKAKQKKAFDEAYNIDLKANTTKIATELGPDPTKYDPVLQQKTADELQSAIDADKAKIKSDQDIHDSKTNSQRRREANSPNTAYQVTKRDDAAQLKADQKSYADVQFGNVFNAFTTNTDAIIADISKNDVLKQALQDAGIKVKGGLKQSNEDYAKNLTGKNLTDFISKVEAGNLNAIKAANDFASANLPGVAAAAIASATNTASASFAETVAGFQAGDNSIGDVRSSYDKTRVAYETAIAFANSTPASTTPGVTESPQSATGKPGVKGADLEKGFSALTKTYLTSEAARTTELQAMFANEELNTAGFIAALDIQIAAIQAEITASTAAGDDVSGLKTKVSQLETLKRQAYSKSVVDYNALRSKLRQTDTGTSSEGIAGLNLDIADDTAVINDPKIDDPSKRAAFDRILTNLQKERQIEANAATTVAERNRILNEQRDLSPELQAVEAKELVDASPALQATTEALKGFVMGIDSGLQKDLEVEYLLGKVSKENVLAVITAEQNRLAEYVAITGGDANTDEAAANLLALKNKYSKALGDTKGDFTSKVSFGSTTPTAGASAADTYADKYAKALADYNKALIEGDPVKVAQQAKIAAEADLANASDDAERLTAQAAIIRADRSLEKAIHDVGSARTDLLRATLQAAGDTVGVAKLNAAEAQKEVDRQEALVLTGGSDQGAVDHAKATATTAAADAVKAQIDDSRSNAQFAFDMQRITKQQFIALLQNLRNTIGITPQLQQDLDRQIKQLQNSLGANLQINLPTTLKLPVLYTSRRIDQSGGSGAGYVDNRNVVITLNVNNGTDSTQMLRVIQDALGGPTVYSTVVKKY